MKKILLFFLLSITFQNSFSQRVYFVYIQTEHDQPFFVRINDKVLSSTATGYILLSKLYDSTYNFSVGFPQNKWPDQKFSLKINGKDHGYLLKDFADKGWGLFDLETMSVQMAAMNRITPTNNSSNSNVSEFTAILAKATDDSTLNQKPVEAKVEEKVTEPIAQVPEKKEEVKTKSEPDSSSLVKKSEPLQQVVKKDEIETAPSTPYKRSTIIRKSESSTTTAFSIAYIDDYGTGRDTILISIPNTPQVSQAKEEQKREIKFLDILPDTANVVKSTNDKEQNNLNQDQGKTDVTDTVANKSVLKNECPATATENDFFELRKNMASANGDDEMIDAANKYFKLDCFTTVQIKNLSTLFLNDTGKYKFFVAAYNHVSDIDNFSSLQMELKDEDYVNKFKAMLRN